MGIKPVSVDAVPEYSGLDGRNADCYYRAGQRLALIYSEVIGPFEASLKESTGYSDENIPLRDEEIPVELGDMRFLLQATPAAKRPEYREVVDGIRGFLEKRRDEYLSGERPRGVMTIDDKPYVSLRDVLSMIREARDAVVSGGVRITISEKPELPAMASSMVVPLGMDMSGLNEGNASRYLEALGMQEEYARFISAFESDLLGLTGFSDVNPPSQTEHTYRRLGRHIFHVRSVPYKSTSWGKVLAGLDSEPPKRKAGNGGDLALIEKGVYVPRLELYGERKRRGEPLIRLDGLLSRIGSLTEENTSTKVRQKPISHYPIL